MSARASINRRALIAGAAIAATAAVGIPQASGGADGISPELAALIAESERRWQTSNAHNRNVYDPLYREWTAGGSADERVKGLLDAAISRETELDDFALEAEAAVEAFPVRGSADMCAKVEYLIPRGWLDCESARVNIVADARRLAGKEA